MSCPVTIRQKGVLFAISCQPICFQAMEAIRRSWKALVCFGHFKRLVNFIYSETVEQWKQPMGLVKVIMN